MADTPEHGITPATVSPDGVLQIPQVTIDEAVDTVRGLADWHIWPRRVEEMRLDHPGGRLVFLRTKQLNEILRVTVDDEDLDVGRVSWSQDGVLELPRNVKAGLGRITVEVDHGYPVADDIVGVVKKMAARATGNESQMTVGGISVGASVAPTPQSAEWRVIDRYKLGPMP